MVAGKVSAKTARSSVQPSISEAERQRRARQRAFSIQEFSKIYGPGRTKVYEELNSGRLRGRKVGRRTIITEDDAEDWLRHLPVIETA
jgi:Helix-turn-helix domain